MIVLAADQALGQTLALIVTFGGVGLVANLLIFYIIAQVLAERRENRDYREHGEA
jgi:CHASE1-domain containing sensor protein